MSGRIWLSILLSCLLMGCPARDRAEDGGGRSAATPEADLVLLGGHVRPELCGGREGVTSIAVADGRIVAVGDTLEIEERVGLRTRVVRLDGEAVLPGFEDAHCHLTNGGAYALGLDLRGVRSIEELQAAVFRAGAKLPPDAWLIGRGWDHTLFSARVLPERRHLDPYLPDRPCVLVRVDGHLAVVNSAALYRAGITEETRVDGGSVDLDPFTAQPNGLLRERALGLVLEHIPRPSDAERAGAVEAALLHAAALGIVAVHSGGDDLGVLRALRRENRLPIRVYAWGSLEGDIALQAKMRDEMGDDPFLQFRCLKGMVDGSLGSRTAALLAPYEDDKTTTGILRLEAETLSRLVLEADQAGFQVALHAIGDRAVRLSLDAFAYARDHGGRGTRHRIEHAQVVEDSDLARFAELGVVASIQPCHLMTDMRWAGSRLGDRRKRTAYAWARLLEAGAILALGTDWPVEPLDPLANLYAAVTRSDRQGRKWSEGTPLGMTEAIHAYCKGSAYAAFADERRGDLTPGRDADIVILDRPIDDRHPARLLETRVLYTICAGRVVYRKD